MRKCSGMGIGNGVAHVKSLILRGRSMYLEDFMTVYILVLRLNPENVNEVDKDVIMQVFSDKEQAEYSRDRREKEARENGFDDVYVVKPYRVWH